MVDFLYLSDNPNLTIDIKTYNDEDWDWYLLCKIIIYVLKI